jgi:hypothetical protein
MKALKLLFSAPVLAGILMLVVALGHAYGQANTQGVTGKWTAKWTEPKGGKPNKIVLADSEMVLTGTYTADSGEACPVKGSNVVGRVVFTVTCSNFTIKMIGDVAHAMGHPEDDQVVGTYTYDYPNGVSTGRFQMDRDTCWLPEGCKQ